MKVTRAKEEEEQKVEKVGARAGSTKRRCY